MKTHELSRISAIKDILSGRATLCVVAILGVVFLHRLASWVDQKSAAPQTLQASIVSSKILTIYAPAKLIEFAASHGPFRTNDDLARALRDAHLDGYWYGVDIGDVLDNGEVEVLTKVVRPGEFSTQLGWASDVLATLAGHPPTGAWLDHRAAEIFVIDEAYMGRNPIETMKDIEELRPVSASRSLHADHLSFRTMPPGLDD